MKKLFFLCAFLFMSMQIQAQMYMVALVSVSDVDSSCSTDERVLVIVDPTGEQTVVCIPYTVNSGGLVQLHQELNNIMAEGYKLIHTSYNLDSDGGDGGLVDNGVLNPDGVTFILAVP
tara:strand:- start:136 stop:489 length:354 start_codon:yes stop_codon:yes gene_type:complete